MDCAHEVVFGISEVNASERGDCDHNRDHDGDDGDGVGHSV